jgi:excisionase family DNA binding protein
MIKIDDIEIYDVKECAEILHVHPQTVRNYLRQGKLRGQKVGAKQYVTAETIKELLKGGTTKK